MVGLTRIADGSVGLAKLQVLRSGKEKAKVARTIKAGRTTLKLAKLPAATGSYQLKLTVTAGAQKSTDTATLRVRR